MIPTLRIKYRLTTQYVKILLVSLILIGLCTMLLLTNVATPAIAISPSADEPQSDLTTHRAGLSQETAVTITGTTDAFTAGQILENRPAFPLQNASAPVVTVSAEGQNARINTIEVLITYTASATGDSGGRFYTDEETVDIKRVNGTSGTLETVVDIQSVFETKDKLEAEFGSGVTVVPTIESRIIYQYTSSTGQTHRGTVSVGGDITAVGELYSLPSGSEQELQTTGSPATEASAPLRSAAIGAVGGAFVLLFGATLLISHRNGHKELARRIQVKRHEEWVTEIDSYTPHGNINVVQAQTLTGLVNLAIDINERVLYTPQLEEYIVMDDQTMYKFRSEESNAEGKSEFFGHTDPGDVREFDTDGNSITEAPPNANDPFDSADPDSEPNTDGNSITEAPPNANDPFDSADPDSEPNTDGNSTTEAPPNASDPFDLADPDSEPTTDSYAEDES